MITKETKKINRDDFLSTTDFKRQYGLDADILHLAVKRIRKLNLQIKTPKGLTPVIKKDTTSKSHDTAFSSMIDPRGHQVVLRYYHLEEAAKAKAVAHEI